MTNFESPRNENIKPEPSRSEEVNQLVQPVDLNTTFTTQSFEAGAEQTTQVSNFVETQIQGWQSRWAACLPQKGEVKLSSRPIDVTRLVCDDLFGGEQYTPESTQIPDWYQAGLVGKLNEILATRDLKVKEFEHTEKLIRPASGFFTSVLNLFLDETRLGLHKQSFYLRVCVHDYENQIKALGEAHYRQLRNGIEPRYHIPRYYYR